LKKSEIIDLLNKDIEGEHAAIIQYLVHAYAMGEGEMACEIEGIAREEMRHLDWLAEKMVNQGGHPRIEHGKIDRSAKASDMLNADIKIEKQVAAVYERAATETDDPKLRRLLTRIRDHELYHVKVFSGLKKTVKE